MAERDEASALLDPAEAAEAPPGDVLEEDALDRIPGAVLENLLQRRLDDVRHPLILAYRVSRMPIHVQSRARRLRRGVPPPRRPAAGQVHRRDLPRRRRAEELERGLLGYTGTYEGKRVSVQGTGGLPGATIVFEELVQLGVKKLLRVGTCGGLQAHHKLGDMIVAISARPGRLDRDAPRRERAALPDRELGLIHGAVHVAKEIGQDMHVGPIVSSDLFYNPDEGQYERWSKRGVLAVEMEAAALFTVGALRGVQAGCLLIVSDIIVEGEFKRVTDDEMKAAVDRMTRVALATATSSRIRRHRLPRQPRLGERVDRAALAGDGAPRRDEGLEGDALFSERPRPARRPRPRRRGRRREAARRRRRRRLCQRGGERDRGPDDVEIAMIPRGTGWDFSRTYKIPHSSTARSTSR